jgi:sRNA-binding regulator protein Hfq
MGMANNQKAQGRFGARKELKIQNQNIDDPGGFDNLILGWKCVMGLSNGKVLEGVVKAASKYWYIVSTSSGNTVFVNKAFIITITPLEPPKTNQPIEKAGGVGNAEASKTR